VIVVHREYISDLISAATTGAFHALGFPINPGNSSMFPWLSSLAENFESYVFKSLKFLFETDAPSTTAGTVLMAVDYDPEDALPANKRDMMSYRDAIRTVPWQGCRLHCDSEDLHKRKTYFVANENDSAPGFGEVDPQFESQSSTSSDERFDDTGRLIVATSNAQASSNIGELYVEYEVHLQTPSVHGAVNPFFAMYKVNSSGQNEMAATAALPFGFRSSIDIGRNQLNDKVIPYESCWDTAGVRYNTTVSAAFLEFAAPGTYWVECSMFEATITSGNSLTLTLTPTTTGPLMTALHEGTTANKAAGGANRADNVRSFYAVVTGSGGAASDNSVIYGQIELDASGTGLAFNSAGPYSCLIRAVPIPDYGGTASGEFPLFTRVLRRRRKGKRFYPTLSRMKSIDYFNSSMAGEGRTDDKVKQSPPVIADGAPHDHVCDPCLHKCERVKCG
jgi:hypothetical protein